MKTLKKLIAICCILTFSLTMVVPPAHAITYDFQKYFDTFDALQNFYDSKGAPLTENEVHAVIISVNGPYDENGPIPIPDHKVNAINDLLANRIYETAADNFWGSPSRINPVIDYIEQMNIADPTLFDDHPNMQQGIDDWRDIVNGDDDGYTYKMVGDEWDEDGTIIIVSVASTCSCDPEICEEFDFDRDIVVTYSGTVNCFSVALLLFLPIPVNEDGLDCCGLGLGYRDIMDFGEMNR